jgi:hypothetical protein
LIDASFILPERRLGRLPFDTTNGSFSSSDTADVEVALDDCSDFCLRIGNDLTVVSC